MKTKTLIIAEAGVNHNGSLQRALEMIDIAAKSGADYIKFQSFKAEALATTDAPKAKYQIKTTGETENQFEMLKRLELDHEDHDILMSRCKDQGIKFLSTPFDIQSLLFLVDNLKLKEIKLGSGELTNAPLLIEAGKSGVQIILSTGMGTLSEVEAALGAIAFGMIQKGEPKNHRDFADVLLDTSVWELIAERVSLLHCTTEYPAAVSDVNLSAMSGLRHAFKLKVGYSDHTEGEAISLAAVALGANFLEKHFTLDRTLPGPDHAASLEPSELESLIKNVRKIESATGNGVKQPSAAEVENRPVARKTIIAARDLQEGQILGSNDLEVKRAGDGLSPMMFWDLLGRQVKVKLKKGQILTQDYF